MFPTPSDGTCDVSNTAVRQDVFVVEECFMVVNEEAPTGNKQEQIPEDISFPVIKTDPNEVSYVCVCLLLEIFYQCPERSIYSVTPVFLDNSNSCTVGNENVLLLFFWWVGRVSAGWVGLCVIAEKTKIYSHLHVVKNPYPQHDS
jgi:hypothetical protein